MSGRRLAGKVALVTGAARERGIGRGIALSLAEEGCDVVVNDVAAEDEGEELAERIRGLGRRAAFHRADVSDRPQVDEMVEAVVRDFGRLDVVCSNAGVADWQALTELTRSSFRSQVGVNLTGAFNVCQAGARALVEQGAGGRIVVTSSVHVQMAFPAMSVYGATKQALRALVEHMAIELAPYGITANHIGPGWVRSHINDRSPALQTDEDIEATLRAIPLGRACEPEDLGRAVCYLASDDAAYVTGAFLRIDGGFVVGKYS
ncbi:MAG TPA: SDR family NAD(P)-dependent oxidoreductase [Gaiellaceae bacterium]|nr:SDR family NAD(P)-dependent oxidoreductase [Gaiellaceae bacterium]